MRYTTSSTADRRAGRSACRGTSNGTPASARVRLAREIRCPIVAVGTRNARAISSVLSPPTMRRVSAARDWRGSTGWQATNTSARMSSPTAPALPDAVPGTPVPASPTGSATSPAPARGSVASRAYLSWRPRSRRMVSIALRRATVISQAAGLSGTPSSGHCCSALANASWAMSSASPTSRTRRVSATTTLADSIRQTASTVRRTSIPASVACTGSAVTVPGADLLAEPGLVLAHLFGVRLAEVALVDVRPDLEHLVLPARVGRALLGPLDRLFERADLPDPVPADDLLRLGERAVHHRGGAALEDHLRAGGAGLEPVPVEHDPRLDEPLVVGAHRLEHRLHRLGRHLSRRGRPLVRTRPLDHDHDLHDVLLSVAARPVTGHRHTFVERRIASFDIPRAWSATPEGLCPWPVRHRTGPPRGGRGTPVVRVGYGRHRS